MFKMTQKTQGMLIVALLISNIGSYIALGIAIDRAFDRAQTAEREETLARIGDNRMLRSRSNFTLPGFTPTHLERVTRTADTMGIPWWIPAGIAKHENGGDTLEVGMQNIPTDIRLRTPVMEWQYVALERMLNQQAWRVILSDPELLPKVLIPFAQIYKSADPKLWLEQTTNAMVDFRAAEEKPKVRNDSVVSEPPASTVKKKKTSHVKYRKKFRVHPKLKPENQGEEKP